MLDKYSVRAGTIKKDNVAKNAVLYNVFLWSLQELQFMNNFCRQESVE